MWKLAGAAIRNVELLHGVGAPQHQICCQLDIFIKAGSCSNTGETVTTWEFTEIVCCDPDLVDCIQVKGDSEPW